MQFLKDSPRATVRMLSNGHVEKVYGHRHALARLKNEVRVLKYLEGQECIFVPRLIDWDLRQKRIVMSYCGQSVQYLPAERVKEIFAELTEFGVQHDDPELRNITYDARLGRFCVIDFEFATILHPAQTTEVNVAEYEQSLQLAELLVEDALKC